MSRWIRVGEIVAPYGVRGWVKVRAHTDPPQNILSYRPWRLERAGGALDLEVVEGRVHGSGIVARFQGVGDRDGAERLCGTVITVPRAALPPAEEGTYYWADLIGLRVFTLTGQDLGVVTGLMETGANDVLIVQGERERLVPFVVGPYVRSVRLEAGRIEVDWDPDFS